LEASLQAKLVRVLQENRVLGVGEDRDIQVNVRVVAATNRDLDQMGQQSRFRADRFHRLNVLSIRVPPCPFKSPKSSRSTCFSESAVAADLSQMQKRTSR
jgi:transcriptional regulator of aromatic amino acid metabolism